MPQHPMPDADAEPIVERSSRKAQRSAAPPPPPPVFDDSKLIELRKQVRKLTSTNSNLELSVRKLTDTNQLVLKEKDDLAAQVRRLNAQLKTLAVDHQAQLEDLRAKLQKVLAERDMAMRKLVDVGGSRRSKSIARSCVKKIAGCASRTIFSRRRCTNHTTITTSSTSRS